MILDNLFTLTEGKKDPDQLAKYEHDVTTLLAMGDIRMAKQVAGLSPDAAHRNRLRNIIRRHENNQGVAEGSLDEVSLDLAKRARDKAEYFVDMDYDDMRDRPYGYSEKQRSRFQRYIDRKEPRAKGDRDWDPPNKGVAEGSDKPEDMTDKICKKCKKGRYQERSQHDDMEGKVTCSCGHRIDRWSKAKKPGVAEGNAIGSFSHSFDKKEVARTLLKLQKRGDLGLSHRQLADSLHGNVFIKRDFIKKFLPRLAAKGLVSSQDGRCKITSAGEAWLAKFPKDTLFSREVSEQGVAEGAGDQWSVECQGKEYKCNDETHAVNKARSLINYGGQSAIIKQNAKPKYKWALGQKMEPVAEGDVIRTKFATKQAQRARDTYQHQPDIEIPLYDRMRDRSVLPKYADLAGDQLEPFDHFETRSRSPRVTQIVGVTRDFRELVVSTMMAEPKVVSKFVDAMNRGGFSDVPIQRVPIKGYDVEEAQDACYHKVRSRYKVWPSAYASGALVQCRKKGAANWGTGGKKK